MTTPKDERNEDGARPRVGQTLQQARLAAHIEVNKVCADLRISPQALEALEQGNYHLLPGDPYIRALLGSMSRYLGLDPAAIVKEYNEEIGAAPQAQSIAPYADKAHTFSAAHKQIFTVIVIALIAVLFLLIGRLNRGGEDLPPAPAGALPAPTESSLAVPGDSAPESRYLSPDSAGGDSAKDSAAVAPRPAGAPAPGAAALPGTAPAATPAAAAAPDTAGMTTALLKPLSDSVGVRIVRSGKEDFATLLRLGKQIQMSHPDTLTVFTSRRGAVEVTVGGRTVTPNKKRFKIHGTTVKVY